MRAHLSFYVKAQNGKVIQNASVYVYQTGTTTPITETMYAGASGATTVSNPLTSNAQGEVEAWLAGAKRVDLYATDNSNTAYYPNVPAAALSFTAFTETVDLLWPPVDDAGEYLYVYDGADANVANGGYHTPVLSSAFVYYDPSDLVQATSYASDYWATTYAAGTWARLPAGLWAFSTLVGWDTNTAGGRQIDAPYVIDNRMNTEGWDPVQGATPTPNYVPPMILEAASKLGLEQTTNNVIQQRTGVFPISAHMAEDGPVAAVLAEFFQNSGGQRVLDFYALTLWKVR
jgi:hypothetical protein